MDLKLRTYLAELGGTFLLVFVAAGTVCAGHLVATGDGGAPVGAQAQALGRVFGSAGGLWLAAALAEGCVLAVVLSVTCHLSPGCLNPAITLSLWVLKRIEGAEAAMLVGMQLLGAVLAGLALRWLFLEPVLIAARLGTPHLTGALLPTEGASLLPGLVTGVVLEFVFTFLLVVAVFASLFDPRGPRVAGVLPGMAQIAIVLFGFHLTGGCANPARWFGTAMWQLSLGEGAAVSPLSDHLVYWVGPILGALAGGIFYTNVVLPPVKK